MLDSIWFLAFPMNVHLLQHIEKWCRVLLTIFDHDNPIRESIFLMSLNSERHLRFIIVFYELISNFQQNVRYFLNFSVFGLYMQIPWNIFRWTFYSKHQFTKINTFLIFVCFHPMAISWYWYTKETFLF